MRRNRLRSALGALLLGLLLFLPAGTLAWPQGWWFLALFVGCGTGIGLWLERADPALLAARTGSPFAADQAPWDRFLGIVLTGTFWLWLPFMAVDAKRFGWSHVPPWAQVLGTVLVLAAFAGWVWVLKVNTFAATTVRVQSERGQTVVDTGPYAYARHPMYGFALPMLAGTPLLLGSFWGLAWLALLIPLLVARTLGEEAVLTRDLAGYGDYTRRVRYRLVPGLW